MENQIIMTEGNVLDIYKKMVDKNKIDKNEAKAVLDRFYELVKFNNTK